MLFVHCGLHKTGTSSLQWVLGTHAERLKAAGFLAPRSGRGEVIGHHNIAWQLSRDRRFNPLVGGLEALRPEIQGFAGDVIISSEDFEGLLANPQALAPLAALARETGHGVTFVVYLRSQASYLASLYRQCLKEGFGEEYAAFVEEAVEHGAVRRKEWRFQFDFARALEGPAGLDGAKVVARNYHALAGGSTVSDFLAAIGAPPDVIPAEHLRARANERDPPRLNLGRFYRNRMQRELSGPEQAAVAAMAAHVDAVDNPPWVEARLRAAFGASNASVCRRFGAPQEGLVTDPGEATPARRGAVSLARLYSFETALAIWRIARLIAGGEPAEGAPPASAEAQLRRWTAWLAAPEAAGASRAA